MKRRDFLRNSLGIAGFVGLAGNGLIGGALAQGLVENATLDAESLIMTEEAVEDEFKYKGSRIQILRRGYRRNAPGQNSRLSMSSGHIEQWTMKVNGRELRKEYFAQNDTKKDCFSSELLPFQDCCGARKLAKQLLDGNGKLFDLMN